MKPNLVTYTGKTIPLEIIKQLNDIWKKEFGTKPMNPKKRDFNTTFFILFNPEGEVLSVGQLFPVKIVFLGKSYDIQAIGGIVSLIKGKGYGKILMIGIKKYLNENDMIGIGFCGRKNSKFYRKCGFNVAKDLVKRFVQKSKKGDEGDDDVLYFDKTNLMKKVLDHGEEYVFVPFHW